MPCSRPKKKLQLLDANRGVEILVVVNGRMIAQVASPDFRRDLWVQVAAVGEIGDIAELHCNRRPAISG